MLVIPELRRQKLEDQDKFKARLVYIYSSRTATTITEKPCLKKRIILNHCILLLLSKAHFSFWQ